MFLFKSCNTNHFKLGNRFNFQFKRVKVKYYSDKRLKYFGGLMRAGYFDISWIGHKTYMHIEKNYINMDL